MSGKLYDMTKDTLSKGWYSTRGLVMAVGISADRYRRDILGVISRQVKKHGKKVNEYHLPLQLGLF